MHQEEGALTEEVPGQASSLPADPTTQMLKNFPPEGAAWSWIPNISQVLSGNQWPEGPLRFGL